MKHKLESRLPSSVSEHLTPAERMSYQPLQMVDWIYLTSRKLGMYTGSVSLLT